MKNLSCLLSLFTVVGALLATGCNSTPVLLSGPDVPGKIDPAEWTGEWSGIVDEKPARVLVTADGKDQAVRIQAELLPVGKPSERAVPLAAMPVQYGEDLFWLMAPVTSELAGYADWNAFLFGQPQVYVVRAEKQPDGGVKLSEVAFTRDENQKKQPYDPAMRFASPDNNVLLADGEELAGFLRNGKYRTTELAQLKKVQSAEAVPAPSPASEAPAPASETPAPAPAPASEAPAVASASN